MAIEGMDAAMPIETAGFVPQVAIAETAEAGPTLDAALAQAAQAATASFSAGDAFLDADARREAAAPDLWVEDPSGPYRPHAGASHANPVAGMFSAADDPLILHKLTIDDMTRASGTGRYGDSTEDYTWNEMSTGDWDWAASGLVASAQSDITQIVHSSTSLQEAQQRVQQYLVDHGLSSAVQVYNPATWVDGAIVVNGHPLPPPPIMYNFDLMGDQGLMCGTPGGQAASQANYSPVPDTNPDGPDVAIEVLDELYRAGVEHARDLLVAQIEVLDAKFAALSNTQTFMMKDGHVVTGADLKAWWNSLDFRVTDLRFDVGAGGVHNGVSNVRFDAVEGYARWDANGIVFLLLHELTHNSPFGEMMRDVMYTFHEMFGGTPINYAGGDFWFDANEEFANWGAREIMIGLGYSAPTTSPWFGYDNRMPASPLTAPPPPPPYLGPNDGGGGGGGGSGGDSDMGYL